MDNIQNGRLQHEMVNLYKFSFFYEFPQYWETPEPNNSLADLRVAAAGNLGMAIGSVNTLIESNDVTDEEVKAICDLLFKPDTSFGQIGCVMAEKIADRLNTNIDEDTEFETIFYKWWHDIYRAKMTQMGFETGNKLADELVMNWIAHTVFVPEPPKK